MVWGNGLSVAVQKLNRGVVSVLGKERDRLLSCLDLQEQLVDVSASSYEVSGPSLHCLVLSLVFIVLDHLSESFKVDGFVHLVIFLVLQVDVKYLRFDIFKW